MLASLRSAPAGVGGLSWKHSWVRGSRLDCARNVKALDTIPREVVSSCKRPMPHKTSALGGWTLLMSFPYPSSASHCLVCQECCWLSQITAMELVGNFDESASLGATLNALRLALRHGDGHAGRKS